tara:strand:+ start:220 stop:1212 length:993 start_codon:yes stop_codon:yes gene_type:complete
MKIFSKKKILITGGTGSFGESFLKRLLKFKSISEIRVLSRDEEKIDRLRNYYNNEKINFTLGDIREKDQLIEITKGIDYVFHAAALKQVPSCEFFPMEAIKTNVIGTNNLIDASSQNNVKKIVFLSTDKSVYPINAMGMTKAMMEKLALSRARKEKIDLIITRYGNVLGTRGSIIPNIIKRVKNRQKIFLTHEDMTRFVMTMDDAIDLVIFALKNGKNGEIFIKKCKSTKIKNLINFTLQVIGKEKYPIEKIGIRHGEKIHETLISSEEMLKSKNFKGYYKISNDFRTLNYKKYLVSGQKNIEKIIPYSSNIEKTINKIELMNLIKKEII